MEVNDINCMTIHETCMEIDDGPWMFNWHPWKLKNIIDIARNSMNTSEHLMTVNEIMWTLNDNQSIESERRSMRLLPSVHSNHIL